MAAGYSWSARARAASSTSSRPTAPALSSGWFWLPHLGDCTHDGQPSAHAQAAIASRVARSQSRGRAEAALGEAGAARVAVVDEDGEPAGVGVQGGGDAADVPAVAGGEQRQQPDRRVLGGVRGARAGRRRPARPRPRTSSGTVHHTAAVRRVALGQVERLLADHLAAGLRGA